MESELRDGPASLLDVGADPTATFVLTSPITRAGAPADGTVQHYAATGELTLHGTARALTFPVADERIGSTIRGGIREACGSGAGITELRGMGAMIGVELDRPCGELVREALAAGLVINVTADNVVRMLPPLVMSEAEARMVVERLAPLMTRFLEKRVAA